MTEPGEERKGTPYSVLEAKIVANTHRMDQYHRELMQFLIDKLDKPDKPETEDNPVKVTMQFELPEHQRELDDALFCSRFQLALWDVQAMIRQYWKYGEGKVDPEELHRKFWDICEDHGINPDLENPYVADLEDPDESPETP